MCFQMPRSKCRCPVSSFQSSSLATAGRHCAATEEAWRVCRAGCEHSDSLDLYLFSGLSFPLRGQAHGDTHLPILGRWMQAWTREGELVGFTSLSVAPAVGKGE